MLVLRVRTAHDVAPLAHRHAQAGTGETGGAGEAIVAADHVVAVHGRSRAASASRMASRKTALDSAPCTTSQRYS